MTTRDLLTDTAARVCLGRALNVRYFLFGAMVRGPGSGLTATAHLVDAELGFTPARGFKLSVGGRNLFDVYPDRMSENNGFDIFPWPPASPFGYNGRFVYTRLEVTGR